MKKEKQKIKVFTAFSGYDSQMMAMQRLEEMFPDKIESELVGWSEIDEPAIASHNAIFPEAKDLNKGDISKVNWAEVPDFDLFTYSSPCFIAGTKVRTKGGYKEIQDIVVGDEVVSHTGNYRKVTKVMSHEYNGMFLVEISGSAKDIIKYQNGIVDSPYKLIRCTPNHKFYVLEKGSDTPIWKEIRELRQDDKLCEWRIFDKIDNITYNPNSKELFWYTPEHYELIKITEPVTVYNLTVDVDNSYNVYDVICHNCQDFSISGKRHGGEKGAGTRSSLLWECERTIREKRPKYCLLENVKALYADKKFYPLLLRWRDTVNSYGYKSWIQVLNAKDYDVPQGRERVFMVSIRNDVLEQDFDGMDYHFPAPMTPKRKITDFLVPQEMVPEEYYLSPHKVPKFLNLLNHAGDEYEDTLDEEQRDAIASKDKTPGADEQSDIRWASYENGLKGYVPLKNKDNALI